MQSQNVLPLKTWSHGKVILAGEHAVVYGEPAIVSSISLGIEVELQRSKVKRAEHPFLATIRSTFEKQYSIIIPNLHIQIRSTLPEQSGLGSSAALAHAIFQAYGKLYSINITDKEMGDLLMQSEQFMHGRPSGIDAAAVTHTGLFVFKKTVDGPVIQRLPSTYTKHIPLCFLVYSGKPKETTGEMVQIVKELLIKQPTRSHIIHKIGTLVKEITKELSIGRFPYSHFRENQRLLEELGVVGTKAKKMVREIESVGGFAKITGAGGISEGSGMMVCFHNDIEKFEHALKKRLWSYTKLRVGNIEKEAQSKHDIVSIKQEES
ncbi:MAG TPA: hypothetical protein VJ246_02260 [Patescibacteria group bacterium]|nr:hypothetical protein [Patescibacteria group bacterium]